MLATYAYDNLGHRTSLTRGNGVVTSYGHHDNSDYNLRRLSDLDLNFSGSSYDQNLDFSYSPAGQITSRARSNSAFDWVVSGDLTESYSADGLNQYTSVGGDSQSHDSRGNLTDDGSTTYGYDARNHLTSASGGVSVDYDATDRLHRVVGGSTTRFVYDGADVIGENNADGSGVLRRYVHGPGADEPLVWYEGDDTSDRRFLVADERGSIIAVTNSSGAVTNVNAYDAYGVPGGSNVGRFQYTGQMWIAEAGLYHYKARAYHPGIGRFMQTDPIGFDGGMNLYGYVGNDPVNGTDPSGLCTGSRVPGASAGCGGTIWVNPPSRQNGGQASGPGTKIYFGAFTDDEIAKFLAEWRRGRIWGGPPQKTGQEIVLLNAPLFSPTALERKLQRAAQIVSDKLRDKNLDGAIEQWDRLSVQVSITPHPAGINSAAWADYIRSTIWVHQDYIRYQSEQRISFAIAHELSHFLPDNMTRALNLQAQYGSAYFTMIGQGQNEVSDYENAMDSWATMLLQ